MKLAAHAIAKGNLGAATRQLAGCADFVPRLWWWLQGGHSSERWLQFEWAYQLQHVVAPAFRVLCEHRRLDVSLVSAGALPPLWQADPEAAVELKWWGNWYVDGKAVNELQGDIGKVDARQYPAVALLLFLRVETVADDPVRSWIPKQITRRRGVSDVQELRQAYLSKIRKPCFEFEVSLTCSSLFAQASMHGLAFPNRPFCNEVGP